MLPAGPQLRRLASAARTLRCHRHPDLRRGRPLRPPPVQRPTAARHEGPNVGGGTALHQGPAPRRGAVEGAPRRTTDPTAGRAGPRPIRQGRARPGQRRAAGAAPPVRHLRRHRIGDRLRQGVPGRRTAVPVAAPQGPAQGRAGLETIAPPHRAAGAAQPPLRGRVRLRPPHPPTPAQQRRHPRRAVRGSVRSPGLPPASVSPR